MLDRRAKILTLKECGVDVSSSTLIDIDNDKQTVKKKVLRQRDANGAISTEDGSVIVSQL